IGVALAAGVWCLLPPFGDVNLWAARGEAEQLAAQVDLLRTGDRKGFERDGARRQSLKAGFPEIAGLLERAEDAWTRRTNAAIDARTAKVDGTRGKLHELLRRDQYEDLRVASDRVWDDFRVEADQLGQDRALRDFCDYYKSIALLGQQAARAGGL